MADWLVQGLLQVAAARVGDQQGYDVLSSKHCKPHGEVVERCSDHGDDAFPGPFWSELDFGQIKQPTFAGNCF